MNPAVRQVITKADWLAARACPTQAWFQLREGPAAPTEAERFRMKQGQEVGLRAQELFPNGLFVRPRDGATVAEVTQRTISLQDQDTFFEPTFVAEPFAAKVDILRREDVGWHVLEVKSSFPTSDGIEHLVDDLAYTVFVLKRAGQHIRRASLVLLSHDYRFGQSAEMLFQVLDKTADVNERLPEYERVADEISKALLGSELPKPRLVSCCRECVFFATKCIGSGIAHTVFEIPALHLKSCSACPTLALSICLVFPTTSS